MLAVTVVPGTAGSARLDDVAEPDAQLGSVVVEALAVGVCGTDVEIAGGEYGSAPPGEERLILGHESLGRVVDPGHSGFAVGEHVVGIVRRPDPVPCPNCAVGEWDMCSNGGYTERGIKQVHGFVAERWRIEPDYAVRVDKALGLLGVLLELTTVVAKAWEQILTIGRRTFWDPRTVLVVGAGPIGLLAALIGVQRGGEIHVLDRVTTSPKPALVEDLGAVYHTGTLADRTRRRTPHPRGLPPMRCSRTWWSSAR
jgi:threonine dehydrogenase-like Zn-dependent dehydrogenase